jgi:hypothetical protein
MRQIAWRIQPFLGVAKLVSRPFWGRKIAGSSPATQTTFTCPLGAAVAQKTVNLLVVGSNPAEGAHFLGERRIAKSFS